MSSKSRSIRRSKQKRIGKLPQQSTRTRENPLTADRYYPSIGSLPPTNPVGSK